MALLLRLLPDHTEIPFIKWRTIAIGLSALLMVGSIGAFVVKGLNLGIDFRGGTLIEIGLTEDADLGLIRSTVGAAGFGDVSVQEFGAANDVLIQVESQDAADDDTGQTTATRVQDAVRSIYPDVDFRRVEVVGAKVSDELTRAGVIAVVLALGAMLAYIWFRFEWHFSIGAVAATAHDVIATIGMFSITQIEFNLPIVAAILTIVGYSMNDTVVVYDRIRENMRKYKKLPVEDVLNTSINDTLSRTIVTSLTTLIALAALFFLGGEVLRGFSFAMIWGVVIGTYSSIFVAAPLLMLTGVRRFEDLGESSE